MILKVGLAAGVSAVGLLLAGAALGHGPKHNPVRHMHMMQNGIPAQYAEMSNPIAADSASLAAGATLYVEHCASCHGAAGNGESEEGAALEPPAPELKSMMGMPMITDGYLMWTLSEGGEPLETAMPAFKEVLSDSERWQIIRYMTGGFSSS